MFTCFTRLGIWICIAAALLAGCVRKEPVKPSQQSASTLKQEDVQSDKEREMVILFQGLVQMDKQDHLAINRKQAEELLPAVRRNSSMGELSMAEQQIIVGILTVEQRRFVTDYQNSVHDHIQAMKDRKDMDELNKEERERMVQEFQLRRQEQGHQEHNAQESSNADSDAPLPPSDPARKSSNNVEQRLIRLLENKLEEEKK
ncbi:hypothetical protein [Paenibacillus sp. 32352]|uniref:hypothetical protein n=1 Tax=Paenibacillus sp. 32352 TaxID=1969111 RepID=UPI0009ADAE52|nr:hypothetical protein [Paenibacillus sp. 32352]